jgi:hypothetical protein
MGFFLAPIGATQATIDGNKSALLQAQSDVANIVFSLKGDYSVYIELLSKTVLSTCPLQAIYKCKAIILCRQIHRGFCQGHMACTRYKH